MMYHYYTIQYNTWLV